MTNNYQSLTILVAEDDDGHAELIREHLQEAGVQNPIKRFADGQAVWDFFATLTPAEKQAYLLLLDIRMPRMDGVELLKRIKSDVVLRTMPVIMLTTTNDPREVQACYELGCNSYVTKPVNYQQFAEALKRVGLFLLIMQVTPVHGKNL